MAAHRQLAADADAHRRLDYFMKTANKGGAAAPYEDINRRRGHHGKPSVVSFCTRKS
jgi:hypothetical protein